MSIGPILPGRLPASLIVGRLQRNLQLGQQQLARLQDQAFSGQKFFIPSDSPAAAIRTIVLQKTIERKEQMQQSLQIDRSLLSISESVLTTVGDTLNRAKALSLASVGESSLPAERETIIAELDAMVRDVVNSGNTKFRGRYVFGGTETDTLPFQLDAGLVRYNGNDQSIESYIDFGVLMANNVDGHTAFGALSEPVGKDINPALSLSTRISELHSGRSLELGVIKVTLNDGTPQTANVDLTGVQTIDDLKTVLENAFAGGPLNLTVGINATDNGLTLSGGPGVTVQVEDVAGSYTASELGIASAAVAQIDGLDLDPQLTMLTSLSALNGGTGIDLASGFALTNGSTSTTIDLSSPTITTVEDLINTLKTADKNLKVEINNAGNGLSISTRLSGTQFSIGENGGTTAADLGIRTFDETTLLSGLDLGRGVPVESGVSLQITRRDGSEVKLDLAGSTTVQDVLDKINAVDPPFLTASLTSIGNGITLADNPPISGTTPIVPGELGSLEVTLNDGVPQTVVVDLSTATTIQEVQNLLANSFPGPPTLSVGVSPGNPHALELTASSGTVEVAESGVGVTAAKLGILGGPSGTISGTAVDTAVVNSSPLSVGANEIGIPLGFTTGNQSDVPGTPLVGDDTNRRETTGALNALLALKRAVENQDDRDIERISKLLDTEIVRFNAVRGEIGTRLQTIDRVESRLLDEDLELRQSLSEQFDADIAEVVTQVASMQQTLEATLKVASTTLQLNLLSYI